MSTYKTLSRRHREGLILIEQSILADPAKEMPMVAELLELSRQHSEELYLELAAKWAPKLFFWAKRRGNNTLKSVGMKAWTDSIRAGYNK